ncbi:MAG TPA: serine/threonine-protein kinase [Arenimonas sp.]|uniref:serine/threonine-protein kinase n=1 Tax=Arenimonas sp. TaxID=1872635 RepID=UPI002BBBCDEB|nr:serine/threonine-protein kinase [Arenimonas sp.]HMB56268.1 serine/threonine-protein kinase [Arenimonas sp.]
MKTRVGHYEIVAELGRGGMGVVYKGYEPALTRYVAIKELAPSLAHDALLVERFLREARSMASLNDPHIIQIYFIGQENEQPFFVMEFVDGESLSGLLKREGRLTVGDALKILHQSAQGLSVAHDRGVIHRDIKPANLMLSQRGQVKIADFGIALANHDFNSKLTGTGEFVGTPGYLSPEVCLGKAVDQRSDIFALGIVLFESLTGRTPFSDESPLKLMLDVVQSEIPDVREINSTVDPEVAAILARMLAKDPADRYQSTHELIADLEKHPLVSVGGPLSIKTAAPSGPAATLIGMATPVTPGIGMRAPTPPPSVGAPTVAPAVATAAVENKTQPGITQPPSVSPPPARPSRAPLWAGLSLLLLLLAGGAWALRGKIFGTSATPPDVVATAPVPVVDTSAASAMPATTASATTAATTSAATPAVPAPPVPPVTDATAAANTTTAQTPGTGNTATAAMTPSLAATPVGERPHPLRDAVAQRGEERAELRDDAAGAALTGARTFIVQSSGDPALVIPAEQMIEEKLSGAGLHLVQSAGRADVVIRVRAEGIGSQDISFYGQTASLTSAYLSVRPFGRGGRPLSTGIRSKIDYTTLNAEAKVQQALESNLDRVVESIGKK